jgi:hypothetical protein
MAISYHRELDRAAVRFFLLLIELWWLHGIFAEQIESLPLQLLRALMTIWTLSQVWEAVLALPGSNLTLTRFRGVSECGNSVRLYL